MIHSLYRESINQMSTTLPNYNYDVFLSFRGPDTRCNFISFLYNEFVRRNIRTFMDDKELENGREISPELKRAIKESRFAVVVISANYPASAWCLKELVEIMDVVNKGKLTVLPIFYGVDPAHLRWQNEGVKEQFKKHESRENHEEVVSWRLALTNLANYAGYCSSKWQNDAKLVDGIADKISNELIFPTAISHGNHLEETNAHMKALHRLLDLNSQKSVRVIGIWTRGCNGRSALAKFVYQNIRQHFESHGFLESVKNISQDRHMSHLRQECLKKIQGDRLSNSRLNKQKILLVANEVNKLEQLDALAEDFNCFGPGSVVIITTQDQQLLKSAGIKLIYEVEVLRFQIEILARQFAFKERGTSAALESVVHTAKDLVTECIHVANLVTGSCRNSFYTFG